MNRSIIFSLYVPVLMLLPFIVHAGVYKCPGKDGKMEFTDVPCKKEHVDKNNLEFVNEKRQSYGMKKISKKDQDIIISNYEMAKKEYEDYADYINDECGIEPKTSEQLSEERNAWEKWYKCDRKTKPILRKKRLKLEAAERMYRDAVN